MYSHFMDWVESIVGSTFQMSSGQWQDHPGLDDIWVAAVLSQGSLAIDVDDRKPRYKVIVLGPRNGRQHVMALAAVAEALAEATLGDLLPCGAASVRVMSEPTGPGYTTEDRVWFSVDFQLIY